MAAEAAQSAPLRILMTADAVGGVWQYSVDLVGRLCERGCEILVATMGPRPSEQQRRQIDPLTGARLVESDWALEWTPEAERDFDASCEWLLGLQSEFGADVVHLNGYSQAALPWTAPAVVVAHSCVYSWWRAVHGTTPPSDQWTAYHARVSAGLTNATRVIAPSRFMASALASEYAVRPDCVDVIYNFSSIPTNTTASKQPFCLAAGRMWDIAKNLSLLGAIGRQIHWPIRIAGSNAANSEVAGGETVRLLGSLPHAEMLRELSGASLFLHPSLYEPFGLSVLEAARAHCCLLLADIPSLRELWNGCAEFVDPRDPEQWIFEVNRLISDRADRDRLAHLANVRSNRYQVEPAIDRYMAVYRSLSKENATAREGAAA